MHAKMIVGNHLAFIGSENFTQTSLEDNREMGVLLKGWDTLKLEKQFHSDWSQNLDSNAVFAAIRKVGDDKKLGDIGDFWGALFRLAGKSLRK